MIKRGSGKIINVSSGLSTAENALTTLSAYSAAKAAVNQFTRVVAEEVAEHGITVNAVRPGMVNTQLQEELTALGSF